MEHECFVQQSIHVETLIGNDFLAGLLACLPMQVHVMCLLHLDGMLCSLVCLLLSFNNSRSLAHT